MQFEEQIMERQPLLSFSSLEMAFTSAGSSVPSLYSSNNWEVWHGPIVFSILETVSF
jgi:hypothetical protein